MSRPKTKGFVAVLLTALAVISATALLLGFFPNLTPWTAGISFDVHFIIYIPLISLGWQGNRFRAAGMRAMLALIER